MKATFRNADGTTLTIAAKGYDRFDPFDSTVRVIGQLDGKSPDQERTREFHLTFAGNADDLIKHRFSGQEPVLRLSAQGGEILAFASKDPWAQGFAFWRGPFHEVSTFVPFSFSRNVDHLVQHMTGFDIEDVPDGLVLIPRLSGDRVEVQDTSTFVEEVGFVEFYSAARGLRFVPTWTGARVPAGEVWRGTQDDGDGTSTTHILLATESAVAIGVPRQEFPRPEQRMVDFMASVDSLSMTA